MRDEKLDTLLGKLARILEESSSLAEAATRFEIALAVTIGADGTRFEDAIALFDNGERAAMKYAAALLRAFLLAPAELQTALIETGKLDELQAHRALTARAIWETEITAFLSARSKQFSDATHIAYAAFIQDWANEDYQAVVDNERSDARFTFATPELKKLLRAADYKAQVFASSALYEAYLEEHIDEGELFISKRLARSLLAYDDNEKTLWGFETKNCNLLNQFIAFCNRETKLILFLDCSEDYFDESEQDNER